MTTTFKLAIISPSDTSDVIGILSVQARDVKEVLKRAKNNPDMEGAIFYPLTEQNSVTA